MNHCVHVRCLIVEFKIYLKKYREKFCRDLIVVFVIEHIELGKF